MNITLSLSELFIGIGGFIALMLSIAFFLRVNKESLSNLWLALFFFANAYVAFIQVIFATEYILDLPQLMRTKFPVGLLRPALLYLFILYLYRSYKKIKWMHLLHFLPSIMVVIYFIPFYVETANNKVNWLNGELIINNSFLPAWYFHFINIYSGIYLVFSIWTYSKIRDNLETNVNRLILLIFIITIAFLLFANLNVIYNDVPEIKTFMYYIITGGILIGSIMILSSPLGAKIAQKIKYKSTNLDEPVSSEIINKAENALIQQKLYCDPELKLADLAKRIEVKPYLLSQVINNKTSYNFNDYVNKIRIDESVKILSDKSNDHLTIEAVGYEVGFNSRTSFYNAFKKIKNITPAAYKKNVSN